MSRDNTYQTGPGCEIELLKAALCMKDQELFILRGELERRAHEIQMLAVAMERLERTMAASYDVLIRKLERRGIAAATDHKRKRNRC